MCGWGSVEGVRPSIIHNLSHMPLVQEGDLAVEDEE